MKDWIQTHYSQARYDPSKVSLDQLRQIIWAAWEAVPDSYIESLIDSIADGIDVMKILQNISFSGRR